MESSLWPCEDAIKIAFSAAFECLAQTSLAIHSSAYSVGLEHYDGF